MINFVSGLNWPCRKKVGKKTCARESLAYCKGTASLVCTYARYKYVLERNVLKIYGFVTLLSTVNRGENFRILNHPICFEIHAGGVKIEKKNEIHTTRIKPETCGSHASSTITSWSIALFFFLTVTPKLLSIISQLHSSYNVTTLQCYIWKFFIQKAVWMLYSYSQNINHVITDANRKTQRSLFSSSHLSISDYTHSYGSLFLFSHLSIIDNLSTNYETW